MTQTVPAASMIGMVFSMILSVGAPILAFFLIRNRVEEEENTDVSKAVLTGAGIFILFVMFLESAVHRAVFASTGTQLTENLVNYAIYGGFMAALFEETGRFIALRFLLKNERTRTTALYYGVGHGGAEAVLLGATNALSNLLTSRVINAGGAESLLAGVDESLRDQAMQQLTAICTTPSGQFFLSGIERVMALVLQICFSYFVYRAVRDGKPTLFLLSFALHFGVDAVTVLAAGYLSVYVVELLLAVIVCGVAALALKMWRSDAYYF